MIKKNKIYKHLKSIFREIINFKIPNAVCALGRLIFQNQPIFKQFLIYTVTILYTSYVAIICQIVNNKSECGIINNIAEVVSVVGHHNIDFSYNSRPIQMVSIGREYFLLIYDVVFLRFSIGTYIYIRDNAKTCVCHKRRLMNSVVSIKI